MCFYASVKKYNAPPALPCNEFVSMLFGCWGRSGNGRNGFAKLILKFRFNSFDSSNEPTTWRISIGATSGGENAWPVALLSLIRATTRKSKIWMRSFHLSWICVLRTFPRVSNRVSMGRCANLWISSPRDVSIVYRACHGHRKNIKVTDRLIDERGRKLDDGTSAYFTRKNYLTLIIVSTKYDGKF